MKISHPLALAILGCAILGPPAFAQSTAGDTKSKSQAAGGQHADAAGQASHDPAESSDGVKKQPTQGLPSSLVPGSGSWRQPSQPTKSQ